MTGSKWRVLIMSFILRQDNANIYKKVFVCDNIFIIIVHFRFGIKRSIFPFVYCCFDHLLRLFQIWLVFQYIYIYVCVCVFPLLWSLAKTISNLTCVPIYMYIYIYFSTLPILWVGLICFYIFVNRHILIATVSFRFHIQFVLSCYWFSQSCR